MATEIPPLLHIQSLLEITVEPKLIFGELWLFNQVTGHVICSEDILTFIDYYLDYL